MFWKFYSRLLAAMFLYNPLIFFGNIGTRTPETILGGIFFAPLYVGLFRYAFGDGAAYQNRAAQASHA